MGATMKGAPELQLRRTDVPTPAAHVRRPDVDALRAFGIAVVVLVHCAQVFSPWQYWHVQDTERSSALGTLTVLAWPWVMPLFMTLAGIGAWYSLNHRGVRAYLRERTLRLLPPIFLGILLIVPPQVYVERVLQGHFHGSYLSFLTHTFDGLYPEGNLAGGQLWFVGYLYFYILLTTPWLVHFRKQQDARWLQWLETHLSTPAAFLILPALPIVLSQLALRGMFPESLNFVADWAYHAQLLLAYVYGILIAARPALRQRIDQHWPIAVPLWFVGAGWLAWFILFSDGLLPRPYSAAYFVGWSVFAGVGWFGLVALLGAARHFIRAPHRFLAYVSDVALPFYVVHQTAVALLAYFLVQTRAPLALEYAILVPASVALTTLVVEAARLSRLTRYLFGLRQRGPGGTVCAAPALSSSETVTT